LANTLFSLTKGPPNTKEIFFSIFYVLTNLCCNENPHHPLEIHVEHGLRNVVSHPSFSILASTNKHTLFLPTPWSFP
jgi:hypothetical protein